MAKSHAQMNLNLMKLFVQCLENYLSFPVMNVIFEGANRQELLEHIESYHADNSVETKENPEDWLFWCDICPLYFESDLILQFHKRGCHWDHWD